MSKSVYHTFICLLLFTIGVEGVNAQTTINGGSVKGIWTKARSPYRITANIRVDAADTLTIEPGVKVEFGNKVGVYVRGQVKANGAVGDSIEFTVDPVSNYHNLWETTNYGWRGFVFLGDLPDSDTTEFSYCKFSYINKRDTTGCKYKGAAVGYESDSTRFVIQGLGVLCAANRIVSIYGSRFFNSLGSGSAVQMDRGGMVVVQCSFTNLSVVDYPIITEHNVGVVHKGVLYHVIVENVTLVRHAL